MAYESVWKKARHSEESKYDFSKATPLIQQQKCKQINVKSKKPKPDVDLEPQKTRVSILLITIFTYYHIQYFAMHTPAQTRSLIKPFDFKRSLGV